MKHVQSFTDFVNESVAIQEAEIKCNEIVASINEGKVITPAEANAIKEDIKKSIDAIKDAPVIDDKTKVNVVKTGIGLAVINALAEKFGDTPATPEAKLKMKDFMIKVNSARSLDEVTKVIFDVVDYALEVAKNTEK